MNIMNVLVETIRNENDGYLNNDPLTRYGKSKVQSYHDLQSLQIFYNSFSF
jgi:hypothetical protein